MSLTWRVLLVWLMACALPLQGLAAARMQHCAPSHPAVAIVQTVATPDHAAHADHGPGHGGSHHGSGHQDTTHHAAPEAAPAHGAQPGQDGGTGSCSACAACCAPLALFAQVPGLPASPPDALVAQRPPLVVVSFFSDGLDRPPRLPRA